MVGLQPSLPPEPDRFVIIAGHPYAGKTHAALTWPNPIVLDFDRKVTKAGVPTIPFHDDRFVTQVIGPQPLPTQPPNRRDALTMWLLTNLASLPEDSTIILDGLSSVEIAFHSQTETVEGIKAAEGGGRLFGKKLDYFSGLLALLSRHRGRVVITCHLTPIFTRDIKTGVDVATGKCKPMLTGSAAERLAGFSTSMLYAFWMVNEAGERKHYLGLAPSPAFDAMTTATKLPSPPYVPNSYEEFRKCF